MKECCDVLCHNYVDPASIYRILPQIRPDPDLDPVHPYWKSSRASDTYIWFFSSRVTNLLITYLRL